MKKDESVKVSLWSCNYADFNLNSSFVAQNLDLHVNNKFIFYFLLEKVNTSEPTKILHIKVYKNEIFTMNFSC